MMSLQTDFEQAVAASKNLTQRPDNMTLLKMYALYKQGSLGDAQGERPGMTDFINRAKWDAWHGLQGQSQESAMQAYLDLFEELKAQ
jgi:diazepam-binding inhibitor (GABA receptor modulating acyl-CoA-binding protein)